MRVTDDFHFHEHPFILQEIRASFKLEIFNPQNHKVFFVVFFWMVYLAFWNCTQAILLQAGVPLVRKSHSGAGVSQGTS